jgi:SAM-dependent methyltransferase
VKLSDPSHNLTGSDLENVALEGDTLGDYRSFWDRAAQVDALRAVAADASDDEFDRQGADAARILVEHAGPSGRILEIGCGVGRIMAPLAALRDEHDRPRYDVHGIDISAEMVRQGRVRAGERENLTFHVGNGYDLGDLEDDGFDLVYSLLVVQHMPKTIALNYFKEVHRVLALGGRFLLHVPNILAEERLLQLNHFSQPHFVAHPYPMNFYGPFEIVRLLQFAGLWVASVDERMFVLAMKAGLAGAPRTLGRELAEMACELAGLEL